MDDARNFEEAREQRQHITNVERTILNVLLSLSDSFSDLLPYTYHVRPQIHGHLFFHVMND